MFSSKIKSITCNRKIRKALRDRQYSARGNNTRVGVITDLADLRSFSGFYKDLGIKTEDFSVVVCGSIAEQGIDLKNIVLDPKEISLTGEFRSEPTKAFLRQDYNLLICYFSQENRGGSLLAAETMAGKKFGNKPDHYGIYDVEIYADSICEFKEEIIKYYKIFKKNN
ncbi:DUF6913 domain-containing protein [Christiangramia sabulilitoris]|uniref:Uncharacterized protein n=1 Tax=Christiangramia sabulilitoris TaxID=2583991 RepID=A0A550I7R3_9FLAO|nr:hypothetical protein [Christiangramia sabulilitoris]TRO67006.1 hypothetical protein FGM01_03710 [Christiangramia sabulilitoris]